MNSAANRILSEIPQMKFIRRMTEHSITEAKKEKSLPSLKKDQSGNRKDLPVNRDFKSENTLSKLNREIKAYCRAESRESFAGRTESSGGRDLKSLPESEGREAEDKKNISDAFLNRTADDFIEAADKKHGSFTDSSGKKNAFRILLEFDRMGKVLLLAFTNNDSSRADLHIFCENREKKDAVLRNASEIQNALYSMNIQAESIQAYAGSPEYTIDTDQTA